MPSIPASRSTEASLPASVRQEQVLALLQLLGPETVETVLSHVASERASTLRRLLEQPARVVMPRTQLLAIEEFERWMRAFEAEVNPLRLHAPHEESTANCVSGQPAPPVPEVFRPSGDVLADLERISPQQVVAAMASEPPRAVAAVLGRLSPQRTAELLSLMEETPRAAVVQELSVTARTHPQLVERMAEALLARACALPPVAPASSDRVQRLAAVLRAVDKPLRRQMLAAIQAQDAETAEALLDRIHEFADLAALKDRQIQRLLAEVDTTTISTALAGAEEALQQKVLANLSKRARDALQEEMMYQSDVSQRLIDEARKNVVRAMARVEADDS